MWWSPEHLMHVTIVPPVVYVDANFKERQLRRMLPGPSEADYLQRGQLPVFIPNYYRGAWREYPRTAGRSSQLFNTGTVSWAYQCFIEGLCGLKGCAEGLAINPQLPSHWDGMKVVRQFRLQGSAAAQRECGE